MTKRSSILAAASGLAVFTASAASAQTIDYDSFEMLFGEPVTASATGKPQRASDAPASMVIISGEKIRRSGVTHLPDILKAYAGIDVNAYSTAQREVSIRGGNMPFNPRLLIMVDGRQVFLDHYGYTDWMLIGVEPAEIQQVEVVRGPQSALFGFNAVAGVVNIVTKDALSEPSASGRVEVGDMNSLHASLVTNFKLGDKTGLRISGGYEEMENWDDIDAQFPIVGVDPSVPERKNVGAELTSQLTDNVRATIGYTYAGQMSGQQGYAFSAQNRDTELQSLNGLVTADTKAGLIKLQAYFNDYEQNSEATGLLGNELLVVKLEDLFKVGTKNTFRIAGEYRNSEYTNAERPDGTDNGVISYDIYSASGMWEWAALSKLTFTNAVRVDQLEISREGGFAPYAFFNDPADYDESHTVFSFNSSAVYKPTEISSIRASVGRGVQAPALVSLNLASITGGLQLTGDPTLEPSFTNNYELAYDRKVNAINGGFNVTASYMQVEDFVPPLANITLVVDPVSFIPRLQESPVGDFDVLSLETALRGKMKNALGWELNYTYTDLEEDLLTPQVNAAIPLDEGTPSHKVNLTFDYAKGPWEAFLTAGYRSETTQRGLSATLVPAFAEVDATVMLDARIAYEFAENLSVYARGQNIVGQEEWGLSAFEAESNFRIGLGYNY